MDMGRRFRGRLFVMALAIAMSVVLTGCDLGEVGPQDIGTGFVQEVQPTGTGQFVTEGLPEFPEEGPILVDGLEVPAWDGESAYVQVNDGEPFFTDADKARTDPFEDYAELDGLGRCGVAYANVCIELMPTEARGEIGSIRPSGWHTVKYNGLVSGNYLYNRCHLIGFQLAGENANPKNLITGTRYLNIDGMLGFENQVDDYVEETENHVLYRVTPVFEGECLVARGVLMEAWSVEDGGDGVCFCVFAYNNQPGVRIDYMNGDSWRLDGKNEYGEEPEVVRLYVLNTKSGKFHLPECQYAGSMSEANRLEMEQSLQAMLDAGYSPCGSCHPDEEE